MQSRGFEPNNLAGAVGAAKRDSYENFGLRRLASGFQREQNSRNSAHNGLGCRFPCALTGNAFRHNIEGNDRADFPIAECGSLSQDRAAAAHFRSTYRAMVKAVLAGDRKLAIVLLRGESRAWLAPRFRYRMSRKYRNLSAARGGRVQYPVGRSATGAAAARS